MCAQLLTNKKVLITAGPTREAIDPVRFISNHSSGKMGYAIAEACLAQGAFVTLVSGPVCLQLSHHRLTVLQVVSAHEMWLASQQYFSSTDLAIFAAAVADYRPEQAAVQKIKKQAGNFSLTMVKNTDIACEFGKIKGTRQVAVGFALETEDAIENAAAKLWKKNFDMVALNAVDESNTVFGSDTNKITLLKKDGSCIPFELTNKKLAAENIVLHAAACLANKLFPAAQ